MRCSLEGNLAPLTARKRGRSEPVYGEIRFVLRPSIDSAPRIASLDKRVNKKEILAVDAGVLFERASTEELLVRLEHAPQSGNLARLAGKTEGPDNVCAKT